MLTLYALVVVFKVVEVLYSEMKNKMLTLYAYGRYSWRTLIPL
jgi:hypothetical protein